MSTNQNLVQHMRELIDCIKAADVAYYRDDNPTMTDREYDLLVDELKELETTTGLILSGSPTQTVPGEILKELPEGFDKETVREQAMEDIEIAQSKDYESWKSRFAKDLQSSLTEESYDSYLKILEKQGEFKEFGKCTYLGQIKDNKKYGGVIIVVKYEEGNVNYSLAYDEDMNLVSFTM